MTDQAQVIAPQSQEDFEKRYPTADFTKKEFTFTKGENSRIQMYEGFSLKSKLEQQIDQQLLNQEIGKALMRIGVKANPDYGIFYDSMEGKFWLYVPKKTEATDEQATIPKRSEVEAKDGPKNPKVN